MLTYAVLKSVHVGAVVISGLGFVLRFALVQRGSVIARSRPLRVVPHVVDSILLASAFALAWLLRANPLTLPWLGAKIVALPVYIVLGSIALKHGQARTRAMAFTAAIATYAYIVSVALTRDPRGILGLILSWPLR